MSANRKAEAISAFPAVTLLIGLFIGIHTTDIYDIYILALAIILIAINMYMWIKPKFIYQAFHRTLCTLIFILLGIVSYHNCTSQITIEKGKSEAYGYIERYIRSDDNRVTVSFKADSLRVNNKLYTDVEGNAYLSNYIEEITPGTYVRLLGDVDCNNRDSTLFRFYAKKHIVDTTKIAHIPYIVNAIRDWTISTLASCGYTRENTGLLLALILGDKSELDYDIRQNFSDCGIVHILAVSGMHVGIIYLFLCFTIKAPLKRYPVVSSIITIILLWVYAIIAGLAPSIIRATLMMSSYEILKTKTDELRPLSTLYMTLFFILLFTPQNVTSLGLWLSFTAVWGILTFYNHVAYIYRFSFPPFRYIYNSLALSFVAQISTMPILLYTFGTFPNMFLLSNLLTVPLIAPIILGAITALILSPISTIGAEIIAMPVNDLTTFVCHCAKWIASFEYSLTTDIDFGITDLIFSMLALYYLSVWLEENKHRYIIMSISAIVLIIISNIVLPLI